MCCRKPTIGELHRLLLTLGFTCKDMPQGSRAYYHAPSDTILTLPGSEFDGMVVERYIVATRHMLIWRGIVEESELDNLMAAVP